MKSKIICFAVLALTFAVRAEVVEDIKENVRDNWRKIQEKCQDVRELAQELPSLPDDSWFKTDKDDQLKKIRKIQEKIRKELLSVDSCEVLAKTDKLSRKIAAKKQEIAELQEKRCFIKPDKQKKLDEKIKEEQDELQRLTAEHAAEMAKVKKELESIGLQIKGDNLNVLLAMKDCADIIDNVIVARGIYDIVGGLREALSNGDIQTAKRYYGVYLTLADVHIMCYEQYLEKSKYGVWRSGLNQIETKANATIEAATSNIASGEFDESQCNIFRKTTAENNKLICAVQMYRKLLDSHEAAVERKLSAVRKQRTVAQSLYDTVTSTVDFGGMLQSAQDDYAAVMELELPEIAVIDDSITEEQINAISKMLDVN